jgi:lipopolysaccharide biosynthesis regulator YciM
LTTSVEQLSASLGRLWRVVGQPEEAEPRPYVCRGCEARFRVQYHVCPVCGGFSVERVFDKDEDEDEDLDEDEGRGERPLQT